MVEVILGAGGLVVLLSGYLIHKKFKRASGLILLDSPKEAVSLKRELNRCLYFEKVDSRWAETALKQYEQRLDREKKLESILSEKFEPKELTRERYREAATRVFELVEDQLRMAIDLLNQMDSLDSANLKKELTKENAESGPSEAMHERLVVAKQVETQLEISLLQNERAITEVDRLIFSLSEIRTSKASSDSDLETLLADLKTLADRSSRYSKS